MIDLIILFIASLLTFSVFAFDHFDSEAKEGGRDMLLLTMAFLCGAFGALCAMIFFRHRSDEKRFLLFVPLFLFIQLAADVAYRMLFM